MDIFIPCAYFSDMNFHAGRLSVFHSDLSSIVFSLDVPPFCFSLHCFVSLSGKKWCGLNC